VARRLAVTAAALGLLASACAVPAGVQADRIDMLAATCVSIIERRHGDGFDREALAEQAGPAALAAIYDRFDERRPAAVSILRRQCRARPPAP